MRSVSILLIFLCLSVFAPAGGRAHPHEFVDAGITFYFDDQGRLGATGIVWVWDEFTSMLILEDLGLDGDGDGVLTGAERQTAVERFNDWPEGFEGDLYLRSNGAPVELSGPLDLKVDYRDNRLIVSFLRPLPQRIDPGSAPVTLQVYDPTYYVFYDLAGAPKLAGREGCEIAIHEADTAAAQKLYEELLGDLTDEEILEEGKSPEVGGAFADEVVLTCGN
ncbi:DUF1007 family protein [Paracoccus xiamenensis]|uniref:DUF1007 family protein n=1 Tax=Paracoccus xiamenensis TaxID=2714901 RepID=UPI001409A393|nr:DUF1007 family protein [Paracoccus xiamenensis]NHF74529.1 DUF1007 family protein [Paracoccus xiamenensis]